MILVKKPADLRQYLQESHPPGRSLGWVPTMGALHSGHASLIETSQQSNALTACSIFVNPTQFNVASDFEKYPITIEQDVRMLEELGVDLLFLPQVTDIYLHGTSSLEQYDLGLLDRVFEGQYRPGHFQGVCQVMHRLDKLIGANNLYMGQKDYQQCMVVKRLLALTNSATQLHTCPTKRETDGLAMSSRNMRLTPAQRKNATGIYKCLLWLRENLKPGDLNPTIEHAADLLLQYEFKLDYLSFADAITLEPAERWDGQQSLVALVAAFQGEVRLIDNLVMDSTHN